MSTRSLTSRITSMLAEPNVERRADMWRQIHDYQSNTSDDVHALMRAIGTLADLGKLPFEIECFMSAIVIEYAWVLNRIGPIDPDIARFSAEIDRIEASYGLSEIGEWDGVEPPAEWHELIRQYELRADALITAGMQQYCRPEIADLYVNNFEDFEFREQRGRTAVMGE